MSENRSFRVPKILYLELLENKTKVQKHLLNKDFEPQPINVVEKTKTDDDIASSSDIASDEEVNKPNEVIEEDEKKSDEENEEKSEEEEDEEKSDEEVNKAKPDVIKTNDSDVKEISDTESQKESQKESHKEYHNLGRETIVSPSKVGAKMVTPTLGELKKRKKIKLKSSAAYPEEESEEIAKKRNDVFFKYEVLKRMHPSAKIPEFTVFSDPFVMEQKYNLLLNELRLESSIANVRKYTIVFLMVCEFCLGKLNFDMEGFAQEQIASMSTYEDLLIELSGKSYNPLTSSQWPVEYRLAVTFITNLTMFLVGKKIFATTGVNLMGVFNGKIKEPPK